MDTLQERLATLIRLKRHELKMSQEQLADCIGKTPGFVGQVERKESLPSLETLRDLVQCLGIDANSIFSKDLPPHDLVNELFSIMKQMDEHKQQLLLEIARLLLNW